MLQKSASPRSMPRACSTLRIHGTRSPPSAARPGGAATMRPCASAPDGGGHESARRVRAGGTVAQRAALRRATGQVESYFLRANDPDRPRAFWLKATILAPLEGEAEAETWFIFFDGSRPACRGTRDRDISRDAYSTRGATASRITLGDAASQLGGRFDPRGASRRQRVDAVLETRRDALAGLLSILPHAFMVEGPFPRSKLLTPFPSLAVHRPGRVVGERGRRRLARHAGTQLGEGARLRVRVGAVPVPGDRGPARGHGRRLLGAHPRGRGDTAALGLVVRRGRETFRFDRSSISGGRTRASTDRWDGGACTARSARRG